VAKLVPLKREVIWELSKYWSLNGNYSVNRTEKAARKLLLIDRRKCNTNSVSYTL